MSPKTIRSAHIGAILGTALGLALVVVPVASYLVFMGSSQYAAMVLIPAFLGIYILFWGLIGLWGAKLLKSHPGYGACLLVISAVGGSLLGFSLIIWAIPALIEVAAAFNTFQEILRRRNLSSN